ncbi:MAG: class IV adenylate cyclase [Candidatus Nanoarchaeia archaeon]|nr:class IV adenylate cyclase [Candidatus Nanoarchaeia archaeon]
MENIEIELKFPLLNTEELVKKLKLTSKFEKESNEKDYYYNLPHRNFLEKKPISEWLRIRESKKGFSLNYKNWHNKEGNCVSCDEFETKIDDINSLKRIFKNLGIKDLIVVDKTRKTWSYKNTLIAIDNVKELGNFIEVEAKGNFSSIEEAKKYLFKILEEIGAKIGEQDFKGYPWRLLEKKNLI